MRRAGSKSRGPWPASLATLLLDEPFAGIDPRTVEDIQNIIAALRGRGLGVLITDHNVRETLEIAERAYILVDGKILTAGTAEELICRRAGAANLSRRAL